jgi:hypothetical protein
MVAPTTLAKTTRLTSLWVGVTSTMALAPGFFP